MNIRKYKMTSSIASLVLVLVIVSITCLSPYFVYAYEQKNGVLIADNVNVRTGIGTSYDKLKYGDKNVQLSKGHAVTIIDEGKASDGSLWYKISFSYDVATLIGFMHSDYIEIKETIKYEPDEDFEKYLDEQKFPDSYKDSLRALHAKYPKWVFIADHHEYEWEEVLKGESEIGRSLISMKSISSWKSTDKKAYNWETGKWYGFDGGSWAAASEELVAYCLDPRNFLDEKSVFQFEALSYNSDIHTPDGLKSVIDGTFMSETKIENKMSYNTAIMNAAKQSGVSPYNLAVRIIQEQGTNGSGKCISGTVAGYEGYYNFFNIGAYAANGNNAIINGLIYASSGTTYNRPWNTRYASILGGAQYLGSGYINQGQDTLYYQKFDLVGIPYNHQYMTHILAPSLEGPRMSEAYSEKMKQDTALVFKLPVYKKMPKNAVPCPTGDGSPNNALSSLNVTGYNLTPTFNKFTYEYSLIVNNSVSSVTVKATALDSTATVGGLGKKKLKVGSNTIKINVTANNGSVKTYVITIVRQGDGEELDENPETPSDTEQSTDKTTEETTEVTTEKPKPSVKSKYTIDDKAYITGVAPDTTVAEAKKKFTIKNATAKIFDAEGKEAKSKSVIGTGFKYVVYDIDGKKNKTYKFVIYGDVSGEGVINIKDLLYVKLHILEKKKLKGAKLMAANACHTDKEVTIKDLLYVKLHILEKMYIVQ